MSQVLVGEIVFKLKADADNLVRSLRQAAQEVRRLEADQKRLTTAASEAKSAIDKESKALDVNSSAMKNASNATRNLGRDKGRLSQVITSLTASFAKLAIKVGIILPLLKVAAQAIGAVTVAAFSFLSALAPLAGALALYPALLGAAGTSMLLLAKSFAPVVEALKHSGDAAKFAEALSSMNPPARALAQSLAQVKRELHLTSIAQAALFPGMNSAITNLSRGIPNLQRATAMLGASLGRVAEHAGRVFSSTRFLRDFDALAASNARTTERFGRGLVNLGAGMTAVLSEAIPLIDKAGQGFERMTLNLNSAIRAAQDSGALEAFFFRTYSVAKSLGNTLGDVAMGLKEIAGNGGSALGGDMLKGLEKAAASFRSFTESIEGATAIRKFFIEMGPVISEFGLLLRDVATGLASLAVGADAAGIFKKIRTELLPVLMEFVAKATTNIIPALIDTATAFAKFASAFAFGPISQILSLVAKGLKEFAEAIASLPSGIITFTAALFGMYKVVKLLSGASLTGIIVGLSGIGATAQAATGRLLGLSAASATASASTRAASAAATVNSQALLGYGAAAAATGGKMATLGKAGAGLLAALGGIPGVAIAAAAAIGYSLFTATQKYQGAAEEATNASKAMVDPATMDFSPAIASMDQARAKLQELADFQYEFKWDNWSNLSDILEARGAASELKELEAAMKSLKDQAFDVDSTVIRLSQAFDLTNDEVITLANQIGVDLRDGVAGAATEFSRFFDYLGDGTAATQQYNAAQEVLNNSLSTAEEKASAFGSALSALGNTGFLGATISVKDAVASLTESFKENGKAFDTNTEAGRRNLEAGLALTEAAKAQVAEAEKQKRPLSEINEIWNSNVRAFEAAAGKLGLTKEQIAAVGEAIGLVPNMPDLVFNTEGLEGAQNKLDGVQTSIRAIEQSTPEFKADANVAEAMAKLGIVNEFATEDRKFDQSVNPGPARATLDLLSVYAKLQRTMPIGANDSIARGVLSALRAMADRPIVIPVRFNVAGVPRFTGRPGAGGVQEANGGILQSFANGGVRKESHVAQIAPAGAWRLWAEPETGGEAYIPLARSKRSRSLEILKQTARRMGVNVEGFANGSPVAANPNTPGSLTRAALTTRRGGGGVEELRALIAAYTAYVAKLEQATRRGELVLALRKAQAEANKKVKRTLEEKRSAIEAVTSAQKALASFDTDARRNAEIAAVEKTIAAIEKETAAREEATAKKRTTEDNMFRVGAMSTDNYLGLLDIRIASEEKFTDAWTSLVEQRKSIMDSEVQAAEAAAAAIMRTQDNMFKVGATNAYDYIAILDQRIAAEVQFSDNWTSLVQQRASIIQSETDRLRTAANEQVQILERQASDLQRIADQAQSTAEQSLADLNRLLDQKIQLEHEIAVEEWRLQMARYEAQQQFQNDSLAAQADYNQAVTQAQSDHATNYQRILAKTQEESAKISERYQKDAADALKKHNADIDSILRDRHDVLTSWARIDEEAGPLTALPVEWISGNVRQQIGQFDKWSKALEAARDRGVSEQVISALNLDAGPQTLGQLEAFAAATESEIADLNALVIARSAQAGKQVADEARKTHTALGRALTEASRLYNEEATALRQAHKQQQVELATQMRIDLANENATLNQALADARDTLSTAMAAANARMNDSIVAATAQAATNIAALRDQLASLGFQAGRSLNDAIALGMASGLPGIQNAVAWVQYYAQSATNAAIAAANALTNAQNAATAAANVSFTPPPAPSPQATPSSSSQPASIGGFQPVSANPAHTSIEQIQAATNFGYSMPMNAVRGIHGSTVYIPQGVTPQFTPPIGEGWGWNPGGNYWTRSKFDKGGVLAPGLTAAFNATGRNEYIMTGDQILDKFADIAKVQSDGSGGGGDTVVNVYLDGELVRGVARTEVVKGLGKLATEIASGRR